MAAPYARMWSARSWTRTDHPRCASAAAATSPAMPPPAISAWPFVAIARPPAGYFFLTARSITVEVASSDVGSQSATAC